ncbi:MAG: rRNA maturation RNase YbeY [Bacilli bacterium]|nr:rRNA maturation RNase YbeY [Bacilli bacterium]
MNKVEFYNKTDNNIDELDEIKRVINYAIKKERLENVSFNIIIVNNKYIHKLNKEYRNIDRETDVITFALEDDDSLIIGDQSRVLGDIYISIDKAKEQAKEYNHSLLRELSFLAVHGFYHLLGYDHQTKEEEEVMFRKQEEVLDECKIKR